MSNGRDHDGPDGHAGTEQPVDPDEHFREQDTFRIMLATDNHLGYMEKDPVRGEDSFNAFEEILQLAQEREVDFVLLGGDLFHDNKPSQRTLHATTTLLRQYCLGDKPCAMEILSDQSENFADRFAVVNYEDPNLNVGIPVFTIHGNHDDPSGGGNLCAPELLSATGLVNYFGKQPSLEQIEIKPILLRKGSSYLSLFGLGNIRDERLNRLFRDRKVKMFRPREQAEPWFNLMVLHQNRVAHGRNNFIPESYLADFLHLILWGHEHKCQIDPEANDAKDFYVTQPGSSVATSLCEGESETKHVGILSIQGTTFAIEKIRLRSVRPFEMDEVVLERVPDLYPKDLTAVNEFLHGKVAEMIELARIRWAELNPDEPPDNFPKPLIRLKVEYSGGFTTFNPQRFGQHFIDKVANPKEILHFYRKRTSVRPKRVNVSEPLQPMLPDEMDAVTIEDLVLQYLDAQKLEILPENELQDAVLNQVEKNDKDAVRSFIERTLTETKRAIRSKIDPTAAAGGGGAGPAGGRGRGAAGAGAARGRRAAAADAGDGGDDDGDGDVDMQEDGDERLDAEDTEQLMEEIARVKISRVEQYERRTRETGDAGRTNGELVGTRAGAARASRNADQDEYDDDVDEGDGRPVPAPPPARAKQTARSARGRGASRATGRATAQSNYRDDDGQLSDDLGMGRDHQNDFNATRYEDMDDGDNGFARPSTARTARGNGRASTAAKGKGSATATSTARGRRGLAELLENERSGSQDSAGSGSSALSATTRSRGAAAAAGPDASFVAPPAPAGPSAPVRPSRLRQIMPESQESIPSSVRYVSNAFNITHTAHDDAMDDPGDHGMITSTPMGQSVAPAQFSAGSESIPPTPIAAAGTQRRRLPASLMTDAPTPSVGKPPTKRAAAGQLRQTTIAFGSQASAASAGETFSEFASSTKRGRRR
ncbi:Metallo-dependent phosphatase-like protein [Entophlyctis helioformis]|nr:Metallo-dependent phosphatase-like protein [Entophlyctis helioformis]